MATMLELLRSGELTPEMIEEIAAESGLSVREAAEALERKEKKLAYRKEYNARDYRKAARKRYNSLRKYKEDKVTDAFLALRKR
jgi:alanyl-tRNA synthetase